MKRPRREKPHLSHSRMFHEKQPAIQEVSLPEREVQGKLYVIATPIGNMEDLSLRALRLLGEVQALACEDTRQTRKLFERYQISSPELIFSYHEHNAPSAGARILGLLAQGKTVGLCSDAGYPCLSDPGYPLIVEVLAQGFALEVIPGPSAPPTALVLSGLATSSYTFKGFSPRKPGRRRKFLEIDQHSPHTLIFFESPYRLGLFLQEACEVFGNRQAAVCLELTKKFEEVRRAPLSELAQYYAEHSAKGEVTIVIAGVHPKFLHTETNETPEEENEEEGFQSEIGEAEEMPEPQNFEDCCEREEP